jgi:hypothetical protein
MFYYYIKFGCFIGFIKKEMVKLFSLDSNFSELKAVAVSYIASIIRRLSKIFHLAEYANLSKNLKQVISNNLLSVLKNCLPDFNIYIQFWNRYYQLLVVITGT